MSDLIRKSDVIKLINCFAFSLYKEQDNKIKKVLKEYIEKMPTAYSVDDVVEKLEEIRKVMPYKASCGNEDLYDNSYKYCPYCGKKIKVVE